jgi:hypothetical protein
LTPDPADPNDRFLQGIGHLTEWAKHIITIGSALMVLGAALLKDLVKDARPPFSYVIAGLLVLSYGAMLLALWNSLAFIRRTASSVLTTADTLGSGDELNALRRLVDSAQWAFLAALALFGLLAGVALLTWAIGFAPSVSPGPSPDCMVVL